MADAAAAAASAINNQGAGNQSINQPNPILWVVLALALVLAAFVFSKRKGAA